MQSPRILASDHASLAGHPPDHLITFNKATPVNLTICHDTEQQRQPTDILCSPALRSECCDLGFKYTPDSQHFMEIDRLCCQIDEPSFRAQKANTMDEMDQLHPATDTIQGPPSVLTSLYDLTRDQLAKQLGEWGEPAFRTNQIWRWMYESLVTDVDEMTDVSKSLRTKLKQHYTLSRLKPVIAQRSTDGWTRKWLLRLADGSEVETVLMEYEGVRRTACISSQAGCAMDCSFCATGQMGFLRNLRAGEIIEQVIWVARALAEDKSALPQSRAGHAGEEADRLSNVVFMGMGEPFANYNNTLEAARRLIEPSDKGGFGLGARKLTISTVGLVPGIRKFSAEGLQVNLAVSLHAATDELRSQLVPINRRYPLRELTKAVHDYIARSNRRVSFEWALIDGVNDTPEQAQALVQLVRETFDPVAEKRHMLHVNMIPLNPTHGYKGRSSQRTRIQRFCAILDAAGIPNTLRVRRGIDINAGCGQLKADSQTPSQP